MFRNVSKFRNVTNKPSKETYGDIKVSSPSPTSVYAAASTQFIAVPHGMGSYGNVAILPIKHSEFVRRPDPLVISAHAETLTDLAFNPFNSNVLATCSKEEVVKVQVHCLNVSGSDVIWRIDAWDSFAAEVHVPVCAVEFMTHCLLCD